MDAGYDVMKWKRIQYDECSIVIERRIQSNI
jgi:hypothetical protein